MKSVFETAERKGKRILSAAEFLGLENFFLEAWRKEIAEGKREVDVKKYYEELFEKIGIGLRLQKAARKVNLLE
ncbi:MAG: hypothetical protein QXX33_00225 [Candidatus Hadarchaeales archaeon]